MPGNIYTCRKYQSKNSTSPQQYTGSRKLCHQQIHTNQQDRYAATVAVDLTTFRRKYKPDYRTIVRKRLLMRKSGTPFQ